MHSSAGSAAAALLLILLCSIQSSNVVFAGGDNNNPLSPQASLLRYWNSKISNDLQKPDFLLSKSSPLTAVQYAAFLKLAANSTKLSEQLPKFCSAANLLCFPDLKPSLAKHTDDVNFQNYADINFTNYGTDHVGGKDTFKTYSVDDNVVLGEFHTYSRGSTEHKDGFSAYGSNSNVVDQTFNSYGKSATGGEGRFSNVSDHVNVPNEKFNSYSSDANGRVQSFTTYTDSANSGDVRFSSYGKNSNAAPTSFSSYGRDSNVIGSTFTNYGDKGNAANDTFTSYGTDTNNPQSKFTNYGNEGNSGKDTFTSYRDQANVGDDSFKKYAAKSNSGQANFVNYGNSFNNGTDSFQSYGKGATGAKAGFKSYGFNSTFTEYNKVGTKFSAYRNSTPGGKMGTMNNKYTVEPGKFFKEDTLKTGNIIQIPDIRDKFAKRSFLPRSIVTKLPFSTSKIDEMKKMFHAKEGSSMMKMITDTLGDCERAPSAGESKRCVASIEDMIDFVTSELGRDVVVRTVNSTQGYNSKVMLGKVSGVNGGKITKSVSCHQSLYPYLLYYCHSVPKVRVYEVEILDPVTKAQMNKAAALCHLDTSAWSASHGAFIALNSSPGETEVCHLIFEGDMTWAVADKK